MRRRTRYTLGLCTGLILAGMGCSDSSSPKPLEQAAATPDYDMQATMFAMADALERERVIWSKATRSWDSINEADVVELRNSRDEQLRLGRELDAMLQANPTWRKSACEWYESVLLQPHLSGANAFINLTRMPSTSEGLPRSIDLLNRAYGSKEVVRAKVLETQRNPGHPTAFRTTCVELGFIEE